MSKTISVALAGVITTVLLLSGCDKPRDEPITRRPDVPKEQHKMTYGGPAEIRSQEEYVEQMEDMLVEDSYSYAYFAEPKKGLPDQFQEWEQDW